MKKYDDGESSFVNQGGIPVLRYGGWNIRGSSWEISAVEIIPRVTLYPGHDILGDNGWQSTEFTVQPMSVEGGGYDHRVCYGNALFHGTYYLYIEASDSGTISGKHRIIPWERFIQWA